jgi:D-alanyl-D-alanine carboxypeptidase/D-alanyl-D-alanine-endopeptidase (penicillin-binding protein 4)
VAAAHVDAGLPGILAGLGPAAPTSCLMVSQGARTVYASRSDLELIPASNLKVLTATAVIGKLGPEARIVTRVAATARPANGVLRGNLYLVGAGDPFLRTPQYVTGQDPPAPLFTSLPALAASVRAAGITTIDGQVLGDESRFDTQRAVPTWKASYTAEEDVGPLSALEVNDGFQLTPPPGPAAQPAVMAAAVFSGLLKADGVKITGPAGTGTAPTTAVPVTSISSAPLGQEVGQVLRVSDDTGAELLTKLLGARFGGVGSTTAGVRVIRAQLASDGLPVSDLHALDGSGLDRQDRVTCALMVDDLRHVGTNGAVFAGLPVAGSTGTLATRMVATPAAGRVHAKTGTLDGVSALSGFVMPSGAAAPTPSLAQPLIFSFITNGVSSTSVGEAVADDVGVALAAFPQVPPLADAVPVALRSTAAR